MRNSVARDQRSTRFSIPIRIYLASEASDAWPRKFRVAIYRNSTPRIAKSRKPNLRRTSISSIRVPQINGTSLRAKLIGRLIFAFSQLHGVFGNTTHPLRAGRARYSAMSLGRGCAYLPRHQLLIRSYLCTIVVGFGTSCVDHGVYELVVFAARCCTSLIEVKLRGGISTAPFRSTFSIALSHSTFPQHFPPSPFHS